MIGAGIPVETINHDARVSLILLAVITVVFAVLFIIKRKGRG